MMIRWRESQCDNTPLFNSCSPRRARAQISKHVENLVVCIPLEPAHLNITVIQERIIEGSHVDFAPVPQWPGVKLLHYFTRKPIVSSFGSRTGVAKVFQCARKRSKSVKRGV